MLLIDAYNVLHLPEAHAGGAELALEDLCALVGASRYGGSRVMLVCDGDPPPRMRARARAGGAVRIRLAGAEVVFSGSARSADDEIEDRLRAGGGPGVLLVSDDRRLTRAASRSRAKALSSSTFLAHLLVDRGRRRSPLPAFTRDIPLDAYSVEHWRREFGLAAMDPSQVARAAGRGASPRMAGTRGRNPETDAQRPRGEPQRAGPGPAKGAGEAVGDPEIEALRADPLVRQALEEWNGKLRLEDLDMRRWLGDVRGTGDRRT